jgi:hypothetical protein
MNEKRFLVAFSPLTNQFFAGWMKYMGDGSWLVINKKYEVTESVLAAVKESKKWSRFKVKFPRVAAKGGKT